MSESVQRLQVAAGILRDARGKVLITDRKRACSMREFWEFPGGKLKNGETSTTALRRELAEELGIQVQTCTHLQCIEHRYPDMHVTIDFFLVLEWSGEPTGRDGQQLDWVNARDLDAARLLPADIPVIEVLRDTAVSLDVLSRR